MDNITDWRKVKQTGAIYDPVDREPRQYSVTNYPDPTSLAIVLYPDPVLKRKCGIVEAFDDSLRLLSERMFELMHAHKGIGLAAPQVGIPIRMFVCNATGEPEDARVFVNPEFVVMSGTAAGEEGCLSIPGVTVRINRAIQVVMKAQDVAGQTIQVKGSQLAARVWQHESDHLNGKLIIDTMSTADEIANRRAIKQLKADYTKR